MEPTARFALVRENMKRAFGRELFSDVRLSRPGVYAFADASGAVVYSREKTGLYSVIVGRVPESDGASFKALLNEGIRWLFVNTDALVVRGRIDPSNKACLALVPLVLGTLPAREVSGGMITDTTFARWAKAYGIETALSELRAAGQSEKADKLAKAAGVLSDKRT